MESEQQVRRLLCRSDSSVQPAHSAAWTTDFSGLTLKIQNKNLRKLCYSQLLGYVNAELPWNLTLILGQLRADGYFQSPWLGPRQIPRSQRQWDTAVCRSSSCSRISFHYNNAVKTVQDCLFLLFSVLLMKCSDLAQCPSCLEYQILNLIQTSMHREFKDTPVLFFPPFPKRKELSMKTPPFDSYFLRGPASEGTTCIGSFWW